MSILTTRVYAQKAKNGATSLAKGSEAEMRDLDEHLILAPQARLDQEYPTLDVDDQSEGPPKVGAESDEPDTGSDICAERQSWKVEIGPAEPLVEQDGDKDDVVYPVEVYSRSGEQLLAKVVKHHKDFNRLREQLLEIDGSVPKLPALQTGRVTAQQSYDCRNAFFMLLTHASATDSLRLCQPVCAFLTLPVTTARHSAGHATKLAASSASMPHAAKQEAVEQEAPQRTVSNVILSPVDREYRGDVEKISNGPLLREQQDESRRSAPVTKNATTHQQRDFMVEDEDTEGADARRQESIASRRMKITSLKAALEHGPDKDELCLSREQREELTHSLVRLESISSEPDEVFFDALEELRELTSSILPSDHGEEDQFFDALNQLLNEVDECASPVQAAADTSASAEEQRRTDIPAPETDAPPEQSQTDAAPEHQSDVAPGALETDTADVPPTGAASEVDVASAIASEGGAAREKCREQTCNSCEMTCNSCVDDSKLEVSPVFSKPMRRRSTRTMTVQPPDSLVLEVLDNLHPDRGISHLQLPESTCTPKVLSGSPALMVCAPCAICGEVQESRQGVTTCARPECAETYTAWECAYCLYSCSIVGDYVDRKVPACCTSCGKTTVIVQCPGCRSDIRAGHQGMFRCAQDDCAVEVYTSWCCAHCSKQCVLQGNLQDASFAHKEQPGPLWKAVEEGTAHVTEGITQAAQGVTVSANFVSSYAQDGYAAGTTAGEVAGQVTGRVGGAVGYAVGTVGAVVTKLVAGPIYPVVVAPDMARAAGSAVGSTVGEYGCKAIGAAAGVVTGTLVGASAGLAHSAYHLGGSVSELASLSYNGIYTSLAGAVDYDKTGLLCECGRVTVAAICPKCKAVLLKDSQGPGQCPTCTSEHCTWECPQCHRQCICNEDELGQCICGHFEAPINFLNTCEYLEREKSDLLDAQSNSSTVVNDPHGESLIGEELSGSTKELAIALPERSDTASSAEHRCDEMQATQLVETSSTSKPQQAMEPPGTETSVVTQEKQEAGFEIPEELRAKVDKLSSRFPKIELETVVKVLVKENGHAGRAASALRSLADARAASAEAADVQEAELRAAAERAAKLQAEAKEAAAKAALLEVEAQKAAERAVQLEQEVRGAKEAVPPVGSEANEVLQSGASLADVIREYWCDKANAGANAGSTVTTSGHTSADGEWEWVHSDSGSFWMPTSHLRKRKALSSAEAKVELARSALLHANGGLSRRAPKEVTEILRAQLQVAEQALTESKDEQESNDEDAEDEQDRENESRIQRWSIQAGVHIPRNHLLSDEAPQSDEEALVEPVRWEDDNASPSCRLCSELFTLTLRRHHCRRCGVLVCWECSQKQHALPGFSMPQRVCDACDMQLELGHSLLAPDEGLAMSSLTDSGGDNASTQ
jgi:hypothetical protein